jgi:uncharacterized protein
VKETKNISPDRRKTKKKSKYAANRFAIYLLLSAIIVLLAVLLKIIPEFYPERIESTGSGGEEAELTELPPDKFDVFIIIDDVGNNLSFLDPFLNFPAPITFAVLPQLVHSTESAKRIYAADKELILHQPMEPVGDQDPGPGAIYTWMDEKEISETVEMNLMDFPNISGINNHMGSKATADKETMTSLFQYLAQNDYFFIDSVTTETSVCESIADEFGVPFGKRNSIFLDNDNDRESIDKALQKGLQTAKEYGYAIIIGHVQNGALAELLNTQYGSMIEKGFIFHSISEFDYQES